MERQFYIYFKKWFFGLQNCAVPLGHRQKTFSLTLNVMILQTMRNEFVRFGEHVHIEIMYNILWLEILYKAQNCTIHLAFNRG